MKSEKVRKKFIRFFEKNKHTTIESSSLWPQDDPSVLLTTAGMQQFKAYFLGTKDPVKDFKNKRLASIQKSFRTSDIESVGDDIHGTFFEMLGNFSINDYFKKEAIDFAWIFLTKELDIDRNKLWATYFKGNPKVKRDIEAYAIWQEYLKKERIIGFGINDNWWGPPGSSGPCGPSSEIHYDLTGKPCKKEKQCIPNCTCGRFIEIWNLVFTEYHINKKKKLKKLPKKNIDTGMGLERLMMVVEKSENIFSSDLYQPILNKIVNDKNFGTTNKTKDTIRSRIVADHLKGAFFLLNDGIIFSNKEQGYVLRRIFRRALDQYLLTRFNLGEILEAVIDIYKNQYPSLEKNRDDILNKMSKELQGYQRILHADVSEVVEKLIHLKSQTKESVQKVPSSRKITSKEAFKLYSTYGLSVEKIKRDGFIFNESEFNNEIKKHQELSRSQSKSKFGGHGLDSDEWSDDEKVKMTRLHTATHLLHQALRDVLGNHVKQQGSDINPERLRFDFEHPKKMTETERNKVEEIVNENIKENLVVTSKEMSYSDAIKLGAIAFFKEKYGEKVNVYSIGSYSKELCGGPHVEQTKEIGNFKIITEKSSSSGIRRIKAIVE